MGDQSLELFSSQARSARDVSQCLNDLVESLGGRPHRARLTVDEDTQRLALGLSGDLLMHGEPVGPEGSRDLVLGGLHDSGVGADGV